MHFEEWNLTANCLSNKSVSYSNRHNLSGLAMCTNLDFSWLAWHLSTLTNEDSSVPGSPWYTATQYNWLNMKRKWNICIQFQYGRLFCQSVFSIIPADTMKRLVKNLEIIFPSNLLEITNFGSICLLFLFC